MTPTVAAAPVAKPTTLLGPDDLDVARVVPLPPRPDSLQAAAERAELRAAGAARTQATEAAARRDGDTKNASIFTDVLGPKFNLTRLPATAALMALVRSSEKAAVSRGKAYFRRPRPYIADLTLKACKRNYDPLSSYPSATPRWRSRWVRHWRDWSRKRQGHCSPAPLPMAKAGSCANSITAVT